MSWLTPRSAPTPFEAALSHRPELLSRYRAFYASLWNETRAPRRTLEMCRLRVAAIHDCAQEWQLRDATVALAEQDLRDIECGDFARFTEDERNALAIAELMPYGHHDVTDADVARVRSALGAAGTVALLTAIAFFDVTCRLKLALDIDVQALALDQAPLHQGALV